MELLAKDSFKGADGVWGGDLVDQKYPFAARDKVQHLVGGLVLSLILNIFFGWFTAFLGVLAVAVLIELVELVRYALWQFGKKAKPDLPQPFMSDLVSWRDIVATMVGGLIGLIL